jgi:hypothetical protein
VFTVMVGYGADVINNNFLLRNKNLVFSRWQGLSIGKRVADSIPSAGDLRGDPVDMAASETDAAT